MIPGTPPRDYVEALADADMLMEGLAASHGATQQWDDEIPAWMRTLLNEHMRMFRAGEGWACEHLADGRPGVRHITAWRPGYVYCLACVADGRVPRAVGDENWTCDACRRRVTTDVEITPVVAQVGALLLLYGLCPDCGP